MSNVYMFHVQIEPRRKPDLVAARVHLEALRDAYCEAVCCEIYQIDDPEELPLESSRKRLQEALSFVRVGCTSKRGHPHLIICAGDLSDTYVAFDVDEGEGCLEFSENLRLFVASGMARAAGFAVSLDWETKASVQEDG